MTYHVATCLNLRNKITWLKYNHRHGAVFNWGLKPEDVVSDWLEDQEHPAQGDLPRIDDTTGWLESTKLLSIEQWVLQVFFSEWKKTWLASHTHTQWTSTKIIWFICLRCKQHQPWPRSTVEITKVGARSWRFRSSLCNGPQFGGKGEFLFFKHIPSRSQSIHVNIYICALYIYMYICTYIYTFRT